MMKKFDYVITFNIDSEIKHSVTEIVTILQFSVWLYFFLYSYYINFLSQAEK